MKRKLFLVSLVFAGALSVEAHGGQVYVDKKGVEHGLGLIHRGDPIPGRVFVKDEPVPLPEEWDLRAKGWVSPIRNQGSCGDCWAHAITENLEDQVLRAGKPPQQLSVEQVTDCAPAYGCGGGFMDSGEYAVSPGLALESKYPWRGGGYRCKKPLPPVAEKAVKLIYVGEEGRAPTTDELKQALYQHGSLFVTVAADGSDWDGRDTMRDCGNQSTNHMVEVVGWKKDAENPGEVLFIMRNSWGTSWGDHGFAYMPPGCDSLATEAGGAAYLVYQP